MSDLLTEATFFGEFVIPEREPPFIGKIEYSPTKGILFSYSSSEIGNDISSKVIHGVLDSGEKCTLIGNFHFYKLSSFRMKNGYATSAGRFCHFTLIMGGFFNEDDLVYNTIFNLTSFQTFMCNNSDIDMIDGFEKPAFNMTTDFGEISIVKTGSLTTILGELSTKLFCDNLDALGELNSASKNILSKYNICRFEKINSVDYFVRLRFNGGASIMNMYRYMGQISDLLALLGYNPVYPIIIKIQKNNVDTYESPLELYPSYSISERTLDQIRNYEDFSLFPINFKNINFELILSKWMNIGEKFSTITSSIQFETGFRDIHELHGEIVLYATQVESISHKLKEKKLKYQVPIEKYASWHIRDELIRIFKAYEKDSLGKAIGDLRNEIAHVGKPRHYLDILTAKDMMRISTCLQMTIIGYILSELGVSEEDIFAYQKVHFRTI